MRALISLTFDDGLRCHFEEAVPILNAHGIPATFFVVANDTSVLKDGFWHPRWKKTDWNKKDIQLFTNMIRQGHEFGSHSVHHKHPYLDRDPAFEAEFSKEWIQERLGVEVSSYSYPFCHYTQAIRDAVVHAGYEQARWGANEAYYQLGKTVDQFKIDSRLISKFGYERVRGNYIGHYGSEDVPGWLRSGCWHILMFHAVGTIKDGWWPIPIAEFTREMKELTALRDAGAVEIVTFKEGAQRSRNGAST